MPSLPKPRFGRAARARGLVVPAPPEPEQPNVEVIEAEGLRWINIERPRQADRAWLEERFEFHPLDYEDVFSRNQRLALKDLERTKRYIPETLDIYFDDINDASERVWDMLENFKEVIEGLEATNESVISHRLNDVLRVLTAFSVLMLPLTLIASIFGMNTHVPGEQSFAGFWAVMGVMVVILLGTLALFRKRGWL